mgnify:FL=1|tara:strand:- start:321 stop:1145 length:825 start_codon:yes stop_codon:yes gene_type:complete
MSQSNKLFKWAKYNGNNNSNAYDSDTGDTDDSIGPTNINKDMFSSILRHPYMERLEENKNERNYLVIYRIKTYNELNHVVEFYILNGFLSSTTITDNVDTELQSIYGDKRIKGNVLFKEKNYSFVQVRNNTDTSNWLNIWDILVNKHYFGNNICDNVIDFFKYCGEVSNLTIGTTMCLKPITLYTNIEERYCEYITKTKSIQYCQSETESLIHLRNFKEDDNIRTICFVDDREINDSIHELEYNDYIVKNVMGEEIGEIEWVFKNNNALFSFVK